jgi:hypothetical protein
LAHHRPDSRPPAQAVPIPLFSPLA